MFGLKLCDPADPEYFETHTNASTETTRIECWKSQATGYFLAAVRVSDNAFGAASSGRSISEAVRVLADTLDKQQICGFSVGQEVYWKGQEEICTGIITKISEPQPGNYVLWFADGFSVNSKQVKPM